MPTLRESIRPIVAIIVASAIVMLLLAPLDATEWAEGFRTGLSSEGAEPFEGEGGSGILNLIGPLLKITVLMGVPALITMGVRGLIGRSRSK